MGAPFDKTVHIMSSDESNLLVTLSYGLFRAYYLWLIDDLFPLVFGLRFPLDFFEVKKLKLGGPFW